MGRRFHRQQRYDLEQMILEYIAERPNGDPHGPENLAATMYHLLGINPNDEFYTPEGRPVRIVNNGRVIQDLL